MATVIVTGMTAERMLDIEENAVVDGEVVGDNLILTTQGGDTIDAGNVRGATGSTGATGASGASLYGPKFKTGRYYGPDGTRSTGVLTAGTNTAIPFWVAATHSFNKIGTEVTVAGAAGSLLRLGIYDSDSDGLPGALVLDAGTVTATAIGTKEITISQSLTPGLYWLTCAAHVGSPTIRTVTGTLIGGVGFGALSVATAAAPHSGYYTTGVTGALPTPFAITDTTASPGLVVLKAS